MNKHQKQELLAAFREAQMVQSDILGIVADEVPNIEIELDQILRRLKRAEEKINAVKQPKFGG